MDDGSDGFPASACALPSDSPVFAHVRALLRGWTLGQYLRTRPPSSVVTLSASSTCGQALRALATHGITSAPVFDGGAYLGFVDVGDILGALLSIVNVRELTDDNREYRLRAAGLQLEHQALRTLCLAQDGALIYKADMASTLHDVVLYGFLQPDAAGCINVVHRVGVFDADEDATSDEDNALVMALDGGPAVAAAVGAAMGQQQLQQQQLAAAADGDAGAPRGIRITHVVSQSDVARFLAKRADELGAFADATLQQLGLATKPVVCVPGEMSAINAYATMASNRVSCVGVISHLTGGGLVASLSGSDLRGLLPEHFVALSTPVLGYLTAKASAGWAGGQQQQHAGHAKPHPHTQHSSGGGTPSSSVCTPPSPAQQQQQQQPHGQSPPSPHGQSPPPPAAAASAVGGAQTWGLRGAEGSKPLQLVSVTPTTTVREVLQLLAAHRLHRLHVLDARRRPLGVVAITDLLRVIVGCRELLDAVPAPDLDLMCEQEVDQQQQRQQYRLQQQQGLGGDDDDGDEMVVDRRGAALPVAPSQTLLNPQAAG